MFLSCSSDLFDDWILEHDYSSISSSGVQITGQQFPDHLQEQFRHPTVS